MRTLLCVMALALVVLFMVPASAPAVEKNKMALLFDFGGFANTTVGGYNGGVGGLYYFDKATAFRGSVGGSLYNNGQENQSKFYTISAGIAHDQWSGDEGRTLGYWAFDGLWKHTEFPVVNQYGFDAAVGTCFYAWPSVAFNAEYRLAFLNNPTAKTTTWDLGVGSGQIGVAVFFDGK